MSLYGINAYTSNSYYSTLLAGKNSSLAESLSSFNKKASSSSDNLSNMLSGALKTDPNDLYGLAKKVQLVRSRDYQKELIEGFKEYFSGGSAAAEKAESEAAAKLAENSKLLNGYAGALALNGNRLFSNPEQTTAAVKDFVESYNNTIEGLQSSDSLQALQKGTTLVNTTNAYARTLKRIGISVGSDNKLTLDEDKLKGASAATLRSLFTGSYSYANKIADKASYINRAVNLNNIKDQVYNSKGLMDYYNKMSASAMFASKT